MASNSSPHHSGNPSLKFMSNNKEGKMMIPAKDLNIVWGNDNRYWTVLKNELSPAELHQVSWLEVTGVVESTTPNKNCEVGFRVSLNPDAFGWGHYPIYMMIKKGREGKIAWTKISISPNYNQNEEFDIKGKWMRAAAQQQNLNDRKLYFGLYEVWSGKWKGGIKIHHAYVRELP